MFTSVILQVTILLSGQMVIHEPYTPKLNPWEKIIVMDRAKVVAKANADLPNVERRMEISGDLYVEYPRIVQKDRDYIEELVNEAATTYDHPEKPKTSTAPKKQWYNIYHNGKPRRVWGWLNPDIGKVMFYEDEQPLAPASAPKPQPQRQTEVIVPPTPLYVPIVPYQQPAPQTPLYVPIVPPIPYVVGQTGTSGTFGQPCLTS